MLHQIFKKLGFHKLPRISIKCNPAVLHVGYPTAVLDMPVVARGDQEGLGSVGRVSNKGFHYLVGNHRIQVGKRLIKQIQFRPKK